MGIEIGPDGSPIISSSIKKENDDPPNPFQGIQSGIQSQPSHVPQSPNPLLIPTNLPKDKELIKAHSDPSLLENLTKNEPIINITVGPLNETNITKEQSLKFDDDLMAILKDGGMDSLQRIKAFQRIKSLLSFEPIESDLIELNTGEINSSLNE